MNFFKNQLVNIYHYLPMNIEDNDTYVNAISNVGYDRKHLKRFYGKP